MKFNTNDPCTFDPEMCVGECEIGQYGLCHGCFKGEYHAMGHGPEPTIHHSKRICEYTLTPSRFSYHSKRETGTCAKMDCEKPLQVGDRVVRKYLPGRSRLYCKGCAEVLNII